MGFLEQLDESIKLPNVFYHKFITSYKKNADDVYVFCEGGVDISYYCEQIERLCKGREIHKCPAECKNNVVQIWKYIDWSQYQKNRVLFFVDRDMSYWTGEQQYYDTNVYVTDGYSFENDAISLNMFLKLLEDLYGFAYYSEKERESIKRLYVEKWSKFEKGSYELMGYTLYKYLSSHEHTAKNISMRKCLKIDSDDVWKKEIKGINYKEYYCKQLQISGDVTERVNELKMLFVAEKEHYSIRGKWCLEFLIMLMDYIIDCGAVLAPSLYNGTMKEPKRIVDLTERGAMAIIGPRMDTTESLKVFLTENIG